MSEIHGGAAWARRMVTSSWPAALATLAVVTLVLSGTGIPPTDVLAYLAYLATAVSLPGVVAWQLLLSGLRRDGDEGPTWFEDLTLGTIFGFGVQLPFFLLGVVLGAPWLIWVPPVLAVVAVAAPFGRRVVVRRRGRLDPRAAWALAGVITVGMLALARHIFPRRPLSLPVRVSGNIDETFHQALVADVANRFPPEIPFLLGTRLDYHWFVHAQIAATKWVTGMDTVVLLRQGMLTVTLVLGVLGLAAVALRLSGRPVAAVIAPALLVAGVFHLHGPDYNMGKFLEPYVMAWRFASPSQSYGVMISMPALMLMLEVLRPGRRPSPATWVTLTLALVLLAGAKATFLPIFLCGAVGAWIVGLAVTRRVDRKLTGLVVLVLGVFVFTQLVLFGGQTGAMSFAPLRTPERFMVSGGVEAGTVALVLMTAATLVSWLLYGVGVFGLVRGRLVLDPRTVWLVGAAAAGIAVPFVLHRSGGSQLWFSRSAAELVVLASAWGMAVLLPRPLKAGRALLFAGSALAAGLLAALASVALARWSATPNQLSLTTLAATILAPVALAAVIGLVWLVVPKVRRHGATTAAVLLSLLLGLGLGNVYLLVHAQLTEPLGPAKPGRPLFAKGSIEAARYIRDNSDVYDVVATNIHCAQPDKRRCDNRSFWVSGYTERRVVVQGWGYTAGLNMTAVPGVANKALPIPDTERLEINDAAFLQPSEETVERLVEEYGADWFFVNKKHPADLDGLADLPTVLEKRFENDNYVVYEVRS